MIRYKIIDLFDRILSNRFCLRNGDWWKQICKMNGINPYKKQEGEEEYFAFWSKAPQKVEPYTYRFFSQYLGTVSGIIPETTGHFFIERHLNPSRYLPFYCDKNAYGLYLNPSVSTKILAMRINGSRLMDRNFCPITAFSKNLREIAKEDIAKNFSSYDKVCLKPSIDTEGGTGVTFFSKGADGLFRSYNGTELNGKFLNDYGPNFNIQEIHEQHPYLAQFNKSSVNTIRLCVYKSVIDGRLIVGGATFRIGAVGSFVDNGHAGGRSVGIDPTTGRLYKTTFDLYGIKGPKWNNIDFSRNDFVIPEWDKIIAFAKELADRNIHMRLFAMDLSLDCSGKPKMIEINYNSFSFWPFMMCGQDVFNGEAEEVINYCNKQRQTTKGHLRIIYF